MISKSRNLVTGICHFYQASDRNGCFTDNLEERLEYADDIKEEIVTLTNITCEWYDDGYLSTDEFKWLMETLESATHELEL